MTFSTRTTMFAAAALAPFLATTAAVAQAGSESTAYYRGTLSPLNGSGVTGSFTIEQRGQGQIRVHIQATGLEQSEGVNVGHIHGLENGQNSTCPTLAQDDDNDNFIELAEGLETYGPIILDFGDVDPDDDGTVDYSMTFNLNTSGSFGMNMDKSDLFPLANREIVLHGMTLEEGEGSNGGEANGEAGYKVVLPVACGAIEQVSRSEGIQFRRR